MIILPSRGRPDSLRQFFAISRPLEPGILLLDEDDAQTYAAIDLPDNWTRQIGQRAGYVTLLNRAFAQFPDEPWYACWGDDVRCSPAGWDTRLAALAGRDRIAYGNDLLNGMQKCCLPVIGGDLVRRVGWLAYPALGHLYCDQIWHELGRALGCLRYDPTVITEHLHWSVGKQKYDQTAFERPTERDHTHFATFMVHHFEETMARCRV